MGRGEVVETVARGGAVAPETDGARPAERVVLAVDFSAASLGAARWVAGHLRAAGDAAPPERPHDAGADGIDACLVHVVPWPDGAATLDVPLDGERPLRGLRPALLGGLAGFAASLRLERARSLVRVGSPSARVAEVAAAEAARLVVLGRRRDAGRQRIGEPNVIQRVARRARCDVLVVPEGTPGPLAHVVAAVDASPAAPAVVATAIAAARAHGAALTLAHVLSPSHGGYDRLTRRRPVAAESDAAPAPTGEAAYRDAAYAWLAWLARDAAPPVVCRLAVPIGDPARELAELATRRGPSLVVVGKRGADEAPHGSLGSVARELLSRCPSPVLAVEGEAADGRRTA